MKKVWQNISKGSFAMILLSVMDIAFSEVNAKSFSVQNSPHLPSANIIQFEDGRDYFSYQEPIVQAKRNDRKIPFNFSLTMTAEFALQLKISYSFIVKFAQISSFSRNILLQRMRINFQQ